MDAVRDLLLEIERMQCLACLARAPRNQPIQTRDLLETVRIPPSEGGYVLDNLARERLVQVKMDARDPLPREVWLTEAGRQALRNWEDSARRRGRNE